MTTSGTKIVSGTDTNSNHNNNNNNSNNTTNNKDNDIKHDKNTVTSENKEEEKLNIIKTDASITTCPSSPVKVQEEILMEPEQQQQQQQQQQEQFKMSPKSSPNLSNHSSLVNNFTSPPTISITTATTTPLTTRAMQSDEDFNIRFVNLVRMHKCLYDKKVPEYRNRDNQEKAWSLISQETRESVIHCKERWRNLRACLSRYIKQQSGSDPQHKPYYLTEHMSFLLPFLKSTRSGIGHPMELQHNINSNGSSIHQAQTNGISSLAALFQISSPHLSNCANNTTTNHLHLPAMTVIPPTTPTTTHTITPHYSLNLSNGLATVEAEVKHSLSENDDEETIDAFDPAVTATLQQQQQQQQVQNARMSPPLSDTASANSMQHYIPDVQLSELRTPDVPDFTRQHSHQSTPMLSSPAKRIKLECDTSSGMSGRICNCGNSLENIVPDNTDMEFFRSILPDIAGLTAQQKRKLKIGILELIDDVVERYPTATITTTTTPSSSSSIIPTTSINQNMLINHTRQQQRRNSMREWRK